MISLSQQVGVEMLSGRPRFGVRPYAHVSSIVHGLHSGAMTDRAQFVVTDSCIVLIAHGSRNERANHAHRALCAELSQRLGRPVTPCFLEMVEPDLVQSCGDLIERGCTQLGILPLFIAPGNHVERDIPQLIEQIQAAHPQVTIELLQHLGAHPGLIDLLVDQIRAAGGR